MSTTIQFSGMNTKFRLVVQLIEYGEAEVRLKAKKHVLWFREPHLIGNFQPFVSKFGAFPDPNRAHLYLFGKPVRQLPTEWWRNQGFYDGYERKFLIKTLISYAKSGKALYDWTLFNINKLEYARAWAMGLERSYREKDPNVHVMIQYQGRQYDLRKTRWVVNELDSILEDSLDSGDEPVVYLTGV